MLADRNINIMFLDVDSPILEDKEERKSHFSDRSRRGPVPRTLTPDLSQRSIISNKNSKSLKHLGLKSSHSVSSISQHSKGKKQWIGFSDSEIHKLKELSYNCEIQ